MKNESKTLFDYPIVNIDKRNSIGKISVNENSVVKRFSSTEEFQQDLIFSSPSIAPIRQSEIIQSKNAFD